jgi:hypothetical protein
MQSEAPANPQDAPGEIPDEGLPRTDTAVRAVYSLMFAFIAQVVGGIITALAAFSIVYTWITRQEPHPRVRKLGAGLARYIQQVSTYVTYNAEVAPFPFSDLPEQRSAPPVPAEPHA